MNGRSDESRDGVVLRPAFVYFDLDDTLLDHTEAERAALRDLACDLLGIEHESPLVGQLQHAYHGRNRELWSDYSAGRITKSELRERRFEHIVAAFCRGMEWHELDSFYMARYADHWRPIEGAMDVYTSVAERYPVGIITNGFTGTQQAKLNRFPFIGEVARALVISEEVGHLKPDPRLFAVAERRAGVRGESILYVGDSLTSDVHGAVDAGWRAAWYTQEETPAHLPPEVFVFRRWTELGEHLAG